jgi:hypothetical protein
MTAMFNGRMLAGVFNHFICEDVEDAQDMASPFRKKDSHVGQITLFESECSFRVCKYTKMDGITVLNQRIKDKHYVLKSVRLFSS